MQEGARESNVGWRVGNRMHTHQEDNGHKTMVSLSYLQANAFVKEAKIYTYM